MRVPTGQLVDLEESGPVDRFGEPAGRDGGVDLVPARTVAAEDQIPGPIARGRAPVASERLDEAYQVLFGHEAADRQEIGRVGQAPAPVRPVAPTPGCPGEIGVVNGVVAHRDAGWRHAELDQVIPVCRAADDGRVEQPDAPRA